MPQIKVIESAVYGKREDVAGHAAAVKSIKETCKILDTHLKDKNWFVGNSITFADIHMFISLVPAFQLCLDGGFRKAMPELARWFEKMSKLPVVVSRLGFIKPCAKAVPAFKKSA